MLFRYCKMRNKLSFSTFFFFSSGLILNLSIKPTTLKKNLFLYFEGNRISFCVFAVFAGNQDDRHKLYQHKNKLGLSCTLIKTNCSSSWTYCLSLSVCLSVYLSVCWFYVCVSVKQTVLHAGHIVFLFLSVCLSVCLFILCLCFCQTNGSSCWTYCLSLSVCLLILCLCFCQTNGSSSSDLFYLSFSFCLFVRLSN